MKIRTELFLAWRYLRPKRNAVSVITCISIIGVMLGVAVLMVVIAVMAGFTDKMKEKMLETEAHIQVWDDFQGYVADPETVIELARRHQARGTAIIDHAVLVQCGERFKPKYMIGIDPEREQDSIPVSEALLYGEFSLTHGEVLLGSFLAQELQVQIGDKILVHSPAKLAALVSVKEGGGVELNEKARIYLPEEYRVTGIFAVGKYDFDQQTLIVNVDDAADLVGLPWGAATKVLLRIDNPDNPAPLVRELRRQLPGRQVYSWKDLNRKFLEVLTVEKNLQFFLLMVIVLVAAFSIANTMVITILLKTREIGLLKALGADFEIMTMIFVLQGLIVGLTGTLCGLGFGALIIRFRNQLLRLLRQITGIEIFPAEFYFFDQLPASVHAGDLLVISLIAIVLCTVGAIVPALCAAFLDPAKALRYE